jgi:hypothetical protein
MAHDKLVFGVNIESKREDFRGQPNCYLDILERILSACVLLNEVEVQRTAQPRAQWQPHAPGIPRLSLVHNWAVKGGWCYRNGWRSAVSGHELTRSVYCLQPTASGLRCPTTQIHEASNF